MGTFRFKQFEVSDGGCGMKIGSDSVLLGAWFLPRYTAAVRVVDIGAGSGLLALMAAQSCPQAHITAVEIDASAAAACRANIEASPWCHRIDTVCEDFTLWHASDTVDLLISNPPYFTTGEHASDASRAVARHQSALTYKAILSSSILAEGGHIGLVAPAELEDDIIFDATMAGLRLYRLCRVQTSSGKKPSRLLLDFYRPGAGENPLPPEIETLSMRGDDGNLTAEYRDLTSQFYIK